MVNIQKGIFIKITPFIVATTSGNKERKKKDKSQGIYMKFWNFNFKLASLFS